MVFGLCGEEEGSFKDGSGVVGHERIGDIEAFYILYCRGLQGHQLGLTSVMWGNDIP